MMSAPLVHRGPDEEGVSREVLAQYLRLMYVPTPRCIHPSIYKLDSSTILTVDRVPPVKPPKESIRRTWSEHLLGHWDWTSRLGQILMFQAWHMAQDSV